MAPSGNSGKQRASVSSRDRVGWVCVGLESFSLVDCTEKAKNLLYLHGERDSRNILFYAKELIRKAGVKFGVSKVVVDEIVARRVQRKDVRDAFCLFLKEKPDMMRRLCLAKGPGFSRFSKGAKISEKEKLRTCLFEELQRRYILAGLDRERHNQSIDRDALWSAYKAGIKVRNDIKECRKIRNECLENGLPSDHIVRRVYRSCIKKFSKKIPTLDSIRVEWTNGFEKRRLLLPDSVGFFSYSSLVADLLPKSAVLSPSSILIGSLNVARSFGNVLPALKVAADEGLSVDVLCVQESNVSLEFAPALPGYQCFHLPRLSKFGGVSVVVKSSFDVTHCAKWSLQALKSETEWNCCRISNPGWRSGSLFVLRAAIERAQRIEKERREEENRGKGTNNRVE